NLRAARRTTSTTVTATVCPTRRATTRRRRISSCSSGIERLSAAACLYASVTTGHGTFGGAMTGRVHPPPRPATREGPHTHDGSPRFHGCRPRRRRRAPAAAPGRGRFHGRTLPQLRRRAPHAVLRQVRAGARAAHRPARPAQGGVDPLALVRHAVRADRPAPAHGSGPRGARVRAGRAQPPLPSAQAAAGGRGPAAGRAGARELPAIAARRGRDPR